MQNQDLEEKLESEVNPKKVISQMGLDICSITGKIIYESTRLTYKAGKGTLNFIKDLTKGFLLEQFYSWYFPTSIRKGHFDRAIKTTDEDAVVGIGAGIGFFYDLIFTSIMSLTSIPELINPDLTIIDLTKPGKKKCFYIYHAAKGITIATLSLYEGLRKWYLHDKTKLENKEKTT